MKPSIIRLIVDYLEEYNDEDWQTNKWLYGLEMEIYVRKGHHTINEEITTCLDIANVTVYNKGLGIFTIFLQFVELLIQGYDSFEAIYVESVMFPRFGLFLEKQGYTRIPDSLPPSYYKLK
jgi:hypothetical protein